MTRLGLVSLAMAFALGGCGGRDGGGGGGGGEDAGSLTCGDRTCAPGQSCCIDCDGSGMCGPPGPCPGLACMEDGGVPIACGDTTCGVGQVCCIGCDGHGSCGAPGSVCTGAGCIDAGGPPPQD